MATGLLCSLGANNAVAEPGADVPVTRGKQAESSVPADKRGDVLGQGWDKSADRAWTTSGDAAGFHLLIADASRGYQWRTAATLSEAGFDTDLWVGNACVTASGKRAVVVYAPRAFTNKSDLASRGGFTAVVDLDSGLVRKLPVQSSLAYFNPACGTDETAVVTQEGNEDLGFTRLLRVDAVAASVAAPIQVPGQLTSAVPTREGIVAADSGSLVRVSDTGQRSVLATTTGVPFRLAADIDGGVVYLEHDKDKQDRAVVKRATTSGTTTLAGGGLTEVGVTSGKGGRVFITGAKDAAQQTALPASVSLVDAPKGAQLSTDGRLAVTSVRKTQQSDPRLAPADPLAAQPVNVTAKVLPTGKSVELGTSPTVDSMVDPSNADSGRAPSPALGVPAGKPAGAAANGMSAQGNPTDPADLTDRVCSVPRNDPANQAMQPKPRQVEWAVDQAVRGVLTVQRPFAWKNLGMPSYTPQGLFPPIALDGGGYVPAQIMLGLAAQESNMWQAAKAAVPGVTANPLIGNYYGIDYYNTNPNGTPNESDDWTIRWDKADCGYGITQITDHMRLAGKEKGPEDVAWPYQQQRAAALDFAANIAAGLRTLQTKWNEMHQAGMLINNGDPAKIENWFFAVWAYNSGFHPDAHNGTAWGLGWLNNPANPRYPANRAPFLETSYADAANPGQWPYPEKVLGWAGHPIESIETPGTLVAGYRAAGWNGDANRHGVKPPVNQFCNDTNQCFPSRPKVTPNAPEVVGEPAGPCYHTNSAGQYDLQCWYNLSSTWKPDCDYSCGYEVLRFDPGYAYQDDATSYPPTCDLRGLPAGALIVDDVPQGTPSIRPGCGLTWDSAGSFALSYKDDGTGHFPGKVDTHQIGGGFGGHFWFTHTRTAAAEGGRLEVVGTWRMNQARTGPMKVMVALPDHGAQTNLSNYQVNARGGRSQVLRQPGDGNRWATLGTYMFDNVVPEVTLSSVTEDGNGTQDIAFDAVAFVPIDGTYHEETVEAVAVFDENQNIDTPAPSSWLGGPLKDRQTLFNWGFDTTTAINQRPDCQGTAVGPSCLPPALRTFNDRWRTQVLESGTDPVNHPQGKSLAGWIGFSNSYLDRPADDARPASFDDDNRYKIKIKSTVSFVADGAGKVVPGSEAVKYENRTGNTHLPKFFLELVDALRQDYGIAVPDLRYSMPDLNAHDGVWRTPNPIATGVLPGRAYKNVGLAPQPFDLDPAANNGSECVRSLNTSGGTIAYRPMLSQSGPTGAMSDWQTRIANNPAVPEPVKQLAADLVLMFFSSGAVPSWDASAFTQAPPIWEELNFAACSDGSIRKTGTSPVVTASYMPDQYLYHNGKAIDRDGNYSLSNAPVMKGDFLTFAQLSISQNIETSYGHCGAARKERFGNPWGVDVPSAPGINPTTAHFCRTTSADIPDPAYSGDH